MKEKTKSSLLNNDPSVSILGFTKEKTEVFQELSLPFPLHIVTKDATQENWMEWLGHTTAETIILMDMDRLNPSVLQHIVNIYNKKKLCTNEIGYISNKGIRLWSGLFERSWGSTSDVITYAPLFIGSRQAFLKAYAGSDLADPLVAVAYSLQKNDLKFRKLDYPVTLKTEEGQMKTGGMRWRYNFSIPFRYVISGHFFRDLFSEREKPRKEMVYRMLMIVFALFCYFYMPVISRNYGISADEFIDHKQAGYVLDYFGHGDKAALNQPRTLLHYYGSGVQVIITAIAEILHIEDVYTFRHFACSLIGAWGIWIIGLLGLRFGGGLCGLLSMLMLFFTPRFFGHTMNNLKDAPFAVGYIASIYYFIRLFDHYPVFRWRYVLGAVAGIFLAFGTRAGGLMLYPYLIMYGGLFYILKVGWREFYKFAKHQKDFLPILTVILIVLLLGYVVSLILWPFALQNPVGNVLLSLKQLTNIGSGIKTMFDGQQMMSNMLPVTYAPKYLWIGMPVISIIGFLGYLIYLVFRRKEFTIISFFLLFAALFPVVWVMYKNSNLYGGIRHMLFVMPVIVVVAGKFWTLLISRCRKTISLLTGLVWLGLLSLPAVHMLRNQPNDYVYFNEFAGGLKGVYGDYDTDYFFNSLKNSCYWFKKNVQLPEGKKTYIVTNHVASVEEYFKADTNIKVSYSRYYEKHAKNWDYAIWGNMYIDRYQLKNGLFPPEGTLYSSLVDGFPMSVVVRREHPEEVEGFRLEKQGKIAEALVFFQGIIGQQPKNEEIWSKMSKLSFILGNAVQSEEYARAALKYHPHLNEALYMLSLSALQQRKYKEALEAARGILGQNAFSVDGYYLQASVYNEMGRYKEAVDALNKALGYRPDFDRALFLAGEIMLKNKNYQTAINIYNRLQKITNSGEVACALADCYCRMKNYPEALKYLAAVEEVQPNFYPAYKVRLRIALQQEQWQQAAEMLKLTSGKEDDAGLFVLRAMYYKGINRPEMVKSMCEAALKLEPNNAEARNIPGK